MVRPVCTPDCPDRHPACSDRCEKYRAWKAEVQKEKTYTKSLWRQAFELNRPFLFIIGVRGRRFGGLYTR